ncbi:hypothetical protein Y032_0002g933 [Ancylostoma ceylanicum]|uniref:Uncharacterized protein n=1 Tax=Ancylostoma ceylanicum TaxID=53326 RepID=A0A016W3X7_9BILA|nr:hypothetical protein Y032_0002g933 [Ancylostoma ceylanicum]
MYVCVCVTKFYDWSVKVILGSYKGQEPVRRRPKWGRHVHRCDNGALAPEVGGGGCGIVEWGRMEIEDVGWWATGAPMENDCSRVQERREMGPLL